MTRYGIVRRSDGWWFVCATRQHVVWARKAEQAQRFDGMSIAILTAQEAIQNGTRWDVEPIAEPQEARA